MSADLGETLEGARDRWRSAVGSVLAKSGRSGAAEQAQPERLLDSPTYEGFPIRALYTALDALPEPPLPGDWPFVRGGDAHPDVLAGWKVAEEFPAPGYAGPVSETVEEANAAVLDALIDGVSAVVVRVGRDGVPAAHLARLLEGVYLALAPVRLDAGAQFGPAAEAMLDLVAGAGDVGPALSIDLGADPLMDAFAGRAGPTVGEVQALAGRAATLAVRSVTVDGAALHDRGANAAWELAGVIGAATDYLRLLVGAGLDVPSALGQVSFLLTADDDQFMSIAKFRAARRMWGRVAEALGHPDAGAVRLHAVTSLPMMTQRDPWVNMVRTTVAAFAAGVGGADTVQVLPFDVAIPGGLDVTGDRRFARRIARNTQLLLLEESHVGRVLDPAGGSWYVEDLTETLAAQAWSHFREIESRGGFAAARDYLAGSIEAVRSRRDEDIAHRRKPLTGVSEFPNLAEPPLRRTDFPGPPRYAAAFESLRDRSDAHLRGTGARPRALLLPLGPAAENSARVAFTVNLLAAGGIEAINPGTVDSATVGDVARRADTGTAVICGTDARYRDELAGVLTAARAAGLAPLYLAGPPAAGGAGSPAPDGFLHGGVDAVQVLSGLLSAAGA
ncbi:MAG: methylmalonyl-CoA mutase family protein [Mycobacterium sp.]